MRIALFQKDLVWGDPAANCQSVAGMLGLTRGQVDLVVLPEMFSTGFATEPEGIAEEAPASSLEFMKSIAVDLDAAVAGSIALHEGGRYFNRFFFVKPDGVVEFYDKRHLFTYGGEDKRFTAGSKRTVVQWRGVRFLLQVCYDLRFPVWSRNSLAPSCSAAGALVPDFDAILYVASWPSVRRAAWDTLLRARAIENQCFVCGVNRVGSDPSNEYNGGTAFVDPLGAVQVAAPDSEEAVVVCDLDMAGLEAFRAKFPVLADADKFVLR